MLKAIRSTREGRPIQERDVPRLAAVRRLAIAAYCFPDIKLGIIPSIDAYRKLAAEGLAVQLACRVPAVSESGYYARRSRAPSARFIRHAWLTEVIRQVHTASRGTYGVRELHAVIAEHGSAFCAQRRGRLGGCTGSRGH